MTLVLYGRCQLPETSRIHIHHLNNLGSASLKSVLCTVAVVLGGWGGLAGKRRMNTTIKIAHQMNTEINTCTIMIIRIKHQMNTEIIIMYNYMIIKIAHQMNTEINTCTIMIIRIKHQMNTEFIICTI